MKFLDRLFGTDHAKGSEPEADEALKRTLKRQAREIERDISDRLTELQSGVIARRPIKWEGK